MKLNYKIGILAIALAGMISSCAKHDPIANSGSLGQQLPTVSWELGSTVCKAGENVNFRALYYPAPGYTVTHSEVWTAVTRSESAAATVKLTSSLAYSKTYAKEDTVRRSQLVQSYDHSEAEWSGYEYILNASFPTSQTLVPVSWIAPETWDQERFDTYYPSDFQEEFVNAVIDYLTKDSTYYNDLRHVYVNFDFTKEQFEALNAKYSVNFPVETDNANKSDIWFTNTDKVVGKYYLTIEGEQTICHEIPLDQDPPKGVITYDVYDSSFWVFCRYSDDVGREITSIRPEYMPYMKDLISFITFPEWIYNSVEKTYEVSFSRSYKLIPSVKVYDNNNKIGTDTDSKTIDLN